MPGHLPEFTAITVALMLVVPALATFCICLLIWRRWPRFDAACYVYLGLTAATPALYFIVPSWLWAEFPAPFGMLMGLLLGPVIFVFVTLAALISLPFVYGQAVTREIKVLATTVVIALGLVQCTVDYLLMVPGAISS